MSEDAVREFQTHLFFLRHFAQLLIYGSLRAPLVAMGRKLVDAGVIESANDVFHLSLAEITDLASQPRPMAGEGAP